MFLDRGRKPEPGEKNQYTGGDQARGLNREPCYCEQQRLTTAPCHPTE